MTKRLLAYIFILFCILEITSQESKQKDSLILIKAENYLKSLQRHYKNGDYQLHKDYSDSLYNIATQHNLTKMHVLALVNQAVFFKNKSQRNKAIKLYHEALKTCKQIPDDFRTNIIVLVNLGNIYDDIGLPEKAIETMQKVLILTDTLENTEVIRAAALVGMSGNYEIINQYEKSIAYANKAKDIGEKTNNNMVSIIALGNISDAYFKQKKYKKSLQAGQKALILDSVPKSTKRRAHILLNLGLAHYELKNLDSAKIYLEAAKQIAIDKEVLEIEMFTYEYLAKIFEYKGDLKAANDSQKLYSKTRNFYLNENKAATKFDLENDINLKEEAITDNETTISLMETKTRNIIIGSIISCLLLGGGLLFYKKRKKHIEIEEKQLKEKYKNLEQTILNSKVETPELLKPKLESYKNSSLTSKDHDYYKSFILSYMKKERPYLDSELKQNDLAEKLNITSHHLSEILNVCFSQNFYNFINSYRVIEAQNLMKNKNYLGAKILAIAFDSGFKSKASFNRVFKINTGLTPSDYRSKID